MACGAAVAPDCTLGSTTVQSPLPQIPKVLVFPRTVVTMQITALVFTTQKMKSDLTLYNFLK